MKIPAFILSLVLCLSVSNGLRAQNPGAQQDAEEARQKLLKAEDQLDNIQANSEANKLAVVDMKATIAKLQADVAQAQTDNAALKQQLAELQAAFDKAEAAHAKEQKVLLDTVAGMIASGSKGSTKAGGKKKDAASTATPPPKNPTDDTTGANATPPSAAATASNPAPANASSDADPSPAKTQKGYYHIVASGETLTLICNAYREQGVKVTVPEIQKANDLTDKSVLKVGQKLFIPKPGA